VKQREKTPSEGHKPSNEKKTSRGEHTLGRDPGERLFNTETEKKRNTRVNTPKGENCPGVKNPQNTKNGGNPEVNLGPQSKKEED